MPLTYYKPTIAFFGRSANPKLCARKLPLSEPAHLYLAPPKKTAVIIFRRRSL